MGQQDRTGKKSPQTDACGLNLESKLIRRLRSALVVLNL